MTPPPPPPRPAAVRLLQLALAFALLNALLSFENRWPGFGVHLMPRLSFELCLAVAALAAWVAWRGVPSARAAAVLTLGFVALVAVRYADVTAPALLGRPVNVFWDGRHGLDLLRVAAASQPGWRVAAAAAVFSAGLLLLVLVVRLAIGTLVRSLAALPARPLLLGTAGLTAALGASWLAYVPDQRDTRWFFSLPLTPTLVQQTQLVARVLQPERGDAVLGPGPAFDGDLSALAGADGAGGAGGPADVLLLFAESYGAVTLDMPALATALAAPRAQLAQAIAAGGRGVVSARVRSPTFGGASWLAHASLLSGLPITDPGHHDLLLAGTRPTLVRHFARHGYRTVGWKPGIKRPWPEGAFYGFARVADDAGIGYAGPDFGYWRIPDQAAMAQLHAQELDRSATVPDRTPRFAVFATSSTHAPFHPLAPVVADWTRLTGADAYAAADAAAALAAPLALQQPLPNYMASMRYQFDWLADYLRRHAPRPLVLVVIGDHQPPALVTGPGASWDVPVHVVSDNAVVLARLQAQGFVAGLLPPATALGPMHALTPLLLQAFSSGPAVASVAAP